MKIIKRIKKILKYVYKDVKQFIKKTYKAYLIVLIVGLCIVKINLLIFGLG